MIYHDILSLVLYVFPGILILFFLEKEKKSTIVILKFVTIILLSIGFNGYFFTLLRNFNIFSYRITMIYILLGWVTIVLFILFYWARYYYFIKYIFKNVKYHKYEIAVIVFFLMVSLYYSLLFPAKLYDSYLYHLTISKIAANSLFFDYIKSGTGRISWILLGFPQNMEMFWAPFFKVGSESFRLAPPLFGLLLLIEMYVFCKLLNFDNKTTLFSIIFTAFTPFVLIHSSDYYVDLPTTVFFIGFIILAIKYYYTQKKIDLILAFAVLGFSALIKFGAEYIAILIVSSLVILSISSKIPSIRRTILKDRIDYLRKHIFLATIIFSTIVIYPIIWNLTKYNGTWPNNPTQKIDIFWIINALHISISNIFKPNEHGILFLITALYLISLLRHILKKKFNIYSIFHIIIFIWINMSFWGLTIVSRRFGWFYFFGRYIFPIYPLMIISSSKLIQDAFANKNIINYIKRNTSNFNGLLFVLIITNAGMSFQKNIASNLNIKNRQLLRTVNYIVHIYSIAKIIFYRYGYITYHPFVSKEKKLKAIYGDSFDAWQFINRICTKNENILTEDDRLFLLKPFCYDAFSLHDNMTLGSLKKWLKTHDIDYILISKKPLYFYKFQPNIYKYLKSGFTELIFYNKSWEVYKIME